MSPKQVLETSYPDWPTKAEAAAMLQISERNLHRLAAAGKIEQRYRRIPNRRPAPVYNPADLERLVQERRAAFVTPHQETALARATAPVLELLPDWIDMLCDSLYVPAVPIAQKIYLTLDEAIQYSGCTPTRLKRCIREGSLLAIKDGGWKIRRSSLDLL